MRFIQGFKMAISSILSNKMRSFLTMLGVIIGVFAVTALISFTQSATDEVTASVKELGTNLITVSITKNADKVTDTVVDNIEALNTIDIIQPAYTGSVTAKYRDENTVTSFIGSNPDFARMRNIVVETGRNFTSLDVEQRLRVALIGRQTAETLFGDSSPVGEYVNLDGTPFKIVGVLEEQGTSMTGSADDRIVIPSSIASRMTSTSVPSTYYALSVSEEVVNEAKAQMESFITNAVGEDNFITLTNEGLLDAMDEILSTMVMLLAGIAAISLLVGGIGIMNIMLVSVTERTREIGIRKAVGAKRKNILIQFLIESIVLTGLGGVVGILLAVAAASVFSALLDTAITVSGGVILLAMLFSLGIGIIFGMYPANKASKLNPIDALRHE